VTRPAEVELHEAELELERCNEEVSRRRADLYVAESRRATARQRVADLLVAAADEEDERVRAAASNASSRDHELN
jgi:hypothetical protein